MELEISASDVERWRCSCHDTTGDQVIQFRFGTKQQFATKHNQMQMTEVECIKIITNPYPSGLFGWIYKSAEKLKRLICCERKILFGGW